MATDQHTHTCRLCSHPYACSCDIKRLGQVSEPSPAQGLARICVPCARIFVSRAQRVADVVEKDEIVGRVYTCRFCGIEHVATLELEELPEGWTRIEGSYGLVPQHPRDLCPSCTENAREFFND